MRFLPLLVLLAACFSYSQAGEAHLQRLCLDTNYAFETGYNVGLNRGNLDTSWAYSCAPERTASIRAAYQAGYQQGAVNAPIVVRGEYTVRGTSSSSYSSSSSYPTYSTSPSWDDGSECKFSSDCGEGRTCRFGECYGNGWSGASCLFSSDCLSSSCDHSTKTCE
jgi:hypothetical protein